MIFECVVDESCKYEMNEILTAGEKTVGGAFKSLTVCLVFKFQRTCWQHVCTDIPTLLTFSVNSK